jgi:hypothetical protein
MFVVEASGARYLFDCPFDDRADEYPDVYRVYRLSPEASDAVESASWLALANRGEVPAVSVTFDPTRRAAVDAAVLDSLPRPPRARGLTSG